MRNIWRLQNDPRRCDYVSPQIQTASPEDESAGDTDDSTQDSEVANDGDTEEESDDDDSASGVPLITTAIAPTPLY